MRVVRFRDVPEYYTESGKSSRILIDPAEMGAKHLAVGVATYPPGFMGGFHQHTCEESIFILKGRAVLKDEHGKESLVNENSIIYIPPGEKHALGNASREEELMFLWIYTPPGEEQVIKKRPKRW